MINFDLKTIKAVFFDVDGVLSRQTITLHPDGDPLTGAKTESLRLRYERLGVKDVILGADIKIKYYNELKQKLNLKDEEIIFVGDDIPDYEVMQLCALPCCPSDAAPEIKAVSKYISPFPGGEGVARDIIEQVLKAQGKWMHDHTAFGW